MNNPEREIVIATINGLRHAMAWKLIKPLNEGWNAAAFGQQPLDREMVLHQVKAIKECSLKIIDVCQTQARECKKRRCEIQEGPPTKMIK